MKKSNKIIIIAIVAVILIVVGILAFLFLGTNIFKSNKELFNKYASQIDLKSFINSEGNENYTKRLLEEAHTGEGKLTITVGEEIDEEFNFETKSDPENNLASGVIAFNQNKEEKIQAAYLKNEDLYGLQLIYKQYMVLENNNLKEFAKKLGIDEEQIPNKIELDSEEVNIEELSEELLQNLEKISNKYIKLAINGIPEKNYSKLNKQNISVDGKTIEADGYKLVLNANELLNILKKCLNTAKDDTDLFNLLNSYAKTAGREEIDLDKYQDFIEELLSEIDSGAENIDNSVQLTVIMYKQGNNLVKAYAKLGIDNEENKSYLDFSLENNKTVKANFIIDNSGSRNSDQDDEFNYMQSAISNIEVNFSASKNTENGYVISLIGKSNEEEIANLNISCLFGKNNSSDEYETNISIKINALDTDVNVEYSNTITFEDDVEIEEFEEGNYIILNNLSEEQLNNLANNLVSQISERVNIQNTVIGNIFSIMMNNNLFNAAQNARNAAEEAMEEENNMLRGANEQLVSIFNTSFLAYEGEQRGSTVKMLLTAIEASNESNEEHYIYVEYDIEDIDNSKTYDVSFEKDSEGYINEAIIDEQ